MFSTSPGSRTRSTLSFASSTCPPRPKLGSPSCAVSRLSLLDSRLLSVGLYYDQQEPRTVPLPSYSTAGKGDARSLLRLDAILLVEANQAVSRPLSFEGICWRCTMLQDDCQR